MKEPVTKLDNGDFGHERRARTTRRWAAALALAVVTLVGGCAKETNEKAGVDAGDHAAAPTARWQAEERLANLNPGLFGHSAEITNEWLPMKPGTRLSYIGSAIDEDGSVIQRRMEIHVTDLTKDIGGVQSLVSWDLDWADGELVEAELAFFAQDDSGNVWLMGEYPEEYEDGKLIGAPGWIHGIEGARAGIMMQARPELGSASYSQGWGPAVGYTDRARVDSVGQKTCVPADCYEDVLVVTEGSKEEVDAEQLKYYGRGVGNIRVGWRGAGEKEKQMRQLVKVETLDAQGLAEVRAKALALEKSAYQNSQKMYGLTPPSIRAGGP